MELELRNGDYVRAGGARLRRVDGQEALLQRVLIRLTARRGTFPFWETLGSRLWQLGRMPSGARLSAALQYVAEALAEERELTVENVSLTEYGISDGGITLAGRASVGYPGYLTGTLRDPAPAGGETLREERVCEKH